MTSFKRVALWSGLMVLTGSGMAKDPELKTDEQKASYAIGQQIGRNMRDQGLDVKMDVLAASIKDSFEGKKSLLTDAEMNASLQKMQESIQKKQKEQGLKFLAENKAKKGVITTKSGLQYEVVKEGKGSNPAETSIVKVHYRGTFVDGREFDSSYSRNQPAEFPVNGVIPGWTEALKLMKVGSEYNLVVPSELAYGEHGNGKIPPNTVLKFNVTLLEIKAPAQQAAPVAPSAKANPKK